MVEPREILAKEHARFLARVAMTAPHVFIDHRFPYDDLYQNVGHRNPKIKFITADTLMSDLDNILLNAETIILDEAHERGVFDFILPLLRNRLLRDPRIKNRNISIVIMSAKLDIQPLVAYFGGLGAKSLVFSDQVRIKTLAAENNLFDFTMAADDRMFTTLKLFIGTLRHHGGVDDFLKCRGDILVFLARIIDITRMMHRLQYSDIPDEEWEILQFHEDSGDETMQQILAGPEARSPSRLILATNYAATGITIPGVRYVFDCGLAARETFDPKTGITKRIVCDASKSEVAMRAGRAGRTGSASPASYLIRTREEFDQMDSFPPMESHTQRIERPLLQYLANGHNWIWWYKGKHAVEPRTSLRDDAINHLMATFCINRANCTISQVGDVSYRTRWPC